MASETLQKCRANDQENGLPIVDLPDDLLDPDLLCVCEADEIIEFRRRVHFFVGPKQELQIEKNRWETQWMNIKGVKPPVHFIKEATARIADECLRLHIRLTPIGQEQASRLAIADKAAIPVDASNPFDRIQAKAATLMGSYIEVRDEILRFSKHCETDEGRAEYRNDLAAATVRA
jgi:hypothetical protein